MTVPIAGVLIGAFAGLHAAIWGMYKDAPHEGFTWRQFRRSVILAAAAGPVAAWATGNSIAGAADVVILFGLVYGIERAVAETYKTFFRDQDQAKYTIPMQLSVFGRPVTSRPVRWLVGVGYLTAMAGGLLGIGLLQRQLGTELPRWLVAVTVGAAGGWFSAFGGAWKDAPIEGFQPFKFFRSPSIAAAYAWVFLGLTRNWPVVVLAAIGLTVASIETYKTFAFPGKPRGKFADKPILFPAMLRTRRWAAAPYAGIWAGILVALWLAFR